MIVTLVGVRGHAPRNSGAKMVVSDRRLFGSVGGGNLEATAISRARAMLADRTSEPELLTMTLSDRAATDFGVQCCGGEVTVLLEPVQPMPAIAIFGIGHVGFELLRILSRQEIELHLVDSREAMLAASRLGTVGEHGVLGDAVASITVHHLPVPEVGLALLPAGTHVLVMTHDHLEDLAIIETALRTETLGSIGLIGSSSKWARFQKQLRSVGHGDDALARVTSPIGIPEISGKEPASIAVSVASSMLQLMEQVSGGPETDTASAPASAIRSSMRT